ncbi:MAG: PAC2 family protein [Desulfomonile tiedjei]|nr:PAC2 family protein [Desulfomonile tiedjei]
MIEQEKSSPSVEWVENPILRAPYLVVGFHGWSDAASVSSETLLYLRETLKTTLLATVKGEPFVNYSLDRPVARIEDGIIVDLESTSTELSYWINPYSSRDMVFLLGREPHMNWHTYTDVVLQIARKLGVEELYTVGGVQDTVPHTAPPVVSVVGSSPEVVDRTMRLERGLQRADYHGPISIHSLLIMGCKAAGIDAASLWGHAPAYLQRHPRLVIKIVSILNRATGMECSLDLLRQRSADLDHKINEAISRDPNLKQLVESVEGKGRSPDVSSRAEKVIHLDDFLHRDSKKDPE